MSQQLGKLAVAALASILIAATPLPAPAAESPFVRPPELEHHVAFWIEIFTEHDKDQTIIHDGGDPSIRYETLMTQGMDDKDRSALVKDRRQHYAKTLEQLALKPESRWTAEEKQIASLFPQGTHVQRFLKAAGEVRSQRGIREQFVDGMKRSTRWKETIQGIFHGYGMPRELAALPHVESSFNPAALSKAGAAGVWQFTTGTGRRFMRIDRHVDERRDVYVSTHAAARYLKEAHDKLGSWPLAVTSYNHGVAGILRAKREVGSSDLARLIREYDGPAFGFASKNFYAEFLAAIEVAGNAERYFGAIETDPPEEVDRFLMPGPARIAGLARAFGTTQQELKALNPALNPPVLEGRLAIPQGVVVNIPRGRVADPSAAYAALSPEERRGTDNDRVYRVRSGDTLSGIARAHRVSMAALLEANGLGRSTRIYAGQRLTIPSGVN